VACHSQALVDISPTSFDQYVGQSTQNAPKTSDCVWNCFPINTNVANALKKKVRLMNIKISLASTIRHFLESTFIYSTVM
jgi:hypothetical protein